MRGDLTLLTTGTVALNWITTGDHLVHSLAYRRPASAATVPTMRRATSHR